jgi:hypothetical protein
VIAVSPQPQIPSLFTPPIPRTDQQT